MLDIAELPLAIREKTVDYQVNNYRLLTEFFTEFTAGGFSF
jgi:hypothetical protein